MPPHSILYLASQSPRRERLIKLLGAEEVRLAPVPVNEIIDRSLTPIENVEALALLKARTAVTSLKGSGVVVGADTVVVLDDQILGKPENHEDAKRMLRELSGRTHTVCTGVALIELTSHDSLVFSERTDVTFRPLEDREIDAYVATGAPLDKAGSYGIQEDFGAVFVTGISGDFYNVVGLPLSKLYSNLRQFAPAVFKR